MTRDDIIRMAHKASVLDEQHYGSLWADKLEHFANLVAAQVQQKNQPPITHAEGCWSWSEKHYMCALAEIARLRKWHADKN